MQSRIDFSGDQEAKRILEAVRKELINPEVEAKATADYIEKTVIPKRFQEQKGPTGQPWKPSKRVLKSGGRTLSKSNTSEALRFSIKAKIAYSNSGVNINFVIEGPAKEYGYVHNNGGYITNRAGRKTHMIKRQYGYTTQAEKRVIIQDIWRKGLLSA